MSEWTHIVGVRDLAMTGNMIITIDGVNGKKRIPVDNVTISEDGTTITIFQRGEDPLGSLPEAEEFLDG